jgi:uncharacterized protein (TIGR00730 family)
MEKAKRPATDPELRRRIEELIRYKGGGHNEEIVADVVENALKMLADVRSRGDARVIQTALRELRYQFRLFSGYVGRRRVCIFGSARTKPEEPDYLLAREFGRKAVEAGFMVFTGAGPGIMQAGNEGAGPEHSFGANIRLPWEQSANPVLEQDRKLMTFKYFFTRKFTFVRQSDAIVLFPGGFGTLDEGFEALTLMQTGKSRLMPLVLIERPGGTYWKAFLHYVEAHLLRNGLISPDDVHLYQVTDDADQAVRWITRFYRNYHSSRFVREQFVIRLKHAPTESAVAGLNEDFKDIVSGEPFRVIPLTSEEADDNDHPELVRLAFGFNRRDYGRLRQLIDVLNGM